MQSDLDIQRDVLNELKWEPRVSAAHIGVSVKEGVVTLTGHVESLAEKSAAERAAKRVAGVRAVANEIEVQLPESSRRSDEDIARGVVHALYSKFFVPAEQIKVTVNKGWVTLEGEVKWRFQKNLAEKTVRNVRGVVGVSNYITVTPGVSPTEVKSRVEEALKRSAEVDASRITVEVQGDRVILRGRVRSWAEKEEAERTAWSAPGITEVDNQIVVEP